MMTLLNGLTDNCHDYWRLHAKARKTDMPDPDVLKQINECWSKMTDFEKEHVTWVNSLYSRKINIPEIKRQIKILARYLADQSVSDEELESCNPSKRRWWNKEKRYTQLCTLRATMRGKLHFSPTSNWEQLRGIYQIPLTVENDAFLPIDLGLQRSWIEDTVGDFTT